MLNKKLFLFSCSLLSIVPFAIHAEATTSKRTVVAPACLISKLSAPHAILSTKNNLSLVELNQDGIDELIAAKHHQQKPCGGFMDVTDAATTSSQHWSSLSPVKTHTANYKIQYQSQVDGALKQLNPQDIWTDLTTLSGFDDRYANSDNGVKAANWIKSTVETIASNYHRDDVTVYLVPTKGFMQPSVIAKIGNSSEAGVVVGAHMDTLASTYSKKPGADDDGSGSASVLGAARTVLASGLHFKKPIYFIWYSAEEEGLIGSQSVVKEIKSNNIDIDAVIHFDMTGFTYRNDPAMWLIQDYVNKDLTGYLKTLIDTYVKKPVKYTACGYACSDHATWTQNGYRASIAAEAAYENTNPVMHSSQDTMDKLSLDHMTDYSKLATAFAIELANPVS